MRFLIVTQLFYPDTVALGQYVYELCSNLKMQGHQVKVITSAHGYEHIQNRYPKRENVNGIEVFRIRNTAFGKSTLIGRITDILSFDLLLFWQIIFIDSKTCDVIVEMTSPPFTSFMTVNIARFKKIKFAYWVMDLQPELSIVAGLLDKRRWLANFLLKISSSIFRKSDLIIVLDRYMKQYVLSKDINSNKIFVNPLWPIIDRIYDDDHEKNPFRIAKQFSGKIVIMYSGNHSFVHPLDTLLQAALALKRNSKLLFVFIGDGIKKKNVIDFKLNNNLANIITLPYQPANSIHLSLGAADLQVVILGNGQVGFTHPSKIYGAMFIGKPVLYIGPQPSPISDMLQECQGNIIVNHQEVDKLVAKLTSFSNLSYEKREEIGKRNRIYVSDNFDPVIVKNRMAKELEEF